MITPAVNPDGVRYSVSSWGRFGKFKSELIPEDVLKNGFHVGQDEIANQVRICLHKTGTLPDTFILSFAEARKLSKLLMAISEGTLKTGVITSIMRSLHAFSRGRGGVFIWVDLRTGVHLNRTAALNLANQLWRITFNDSEELLDSLLAELEQESKAA